MTVEELHNIIRDRDFNVMPNNLTPNQIYRFTENILRIGNGNRRLLGYGRMVSLTYNLNLSIINNEDIYIETQPTQIGGEPLIVIIVPNKIPLTIQLLKEDRSLFATMLEI